ncbi:MAG: ribosome recycling factor [Bacteroidota bacterium]
MEELRSTLDHAKQAMDKAYTRVQAAFAKIRAGRATPSMLDGILVEYYGNKVPINQVASVSTPDAKTLAIKPWEKSLIAELEKAIINGNLGFTPQNDGETIRINIPPLTEERRKELAKQVKGEAEKGRIAVRNNRKSGKELLKQLQKSGISEDAIKKTEDDLQRLTEQHVTKIDALLKQKEAEVMEV